MNKRSECQCECHRAEPGTVMHFMACCGYQDEADWTAERAYHTEWRMKRNLGKEPPQQPPNCS